MAPHPQTAWQRVQGRLPERGWWTADGAGRRVWPVAAGQRPRVAWWVRRRHSAGDRAYTRRKAPTDPPQAYRSVGSCRRACTARPCEDAKTASGWDACQAQQ